MKNYYQVLGLDNNASIVDVEEKYQILINEYNPNIHEDELKNYFKLELDKVHEAYSQILKGFDSNIHENELINDAVFNENHKSILLSKTISDSYKLLKLNEDATLAEIINKYKLFIEEFNPDYHSDELKDFFKKEQKKITNSYQIIIKYLSTLNDLKENDTSEQINLTNNENSLNYDSINISDDEEINCDDEEMNFKELENNIKSNSELYISAWKGLSGFWGICILFNLIYFIISSFSTNIILFVLLGSLNVGLSIFYLNVTRKNNPEISNLFDGFNDFSSSFVAYILILISVVIGTCFFIIPGIYLGLSYSMTYYVIADNPGISGLEAMKKSRLLMDGNILKLFFFLIRYLFLFVLGCIPFGLGLFVVIPWFYVAHSKFYENLLNNYKEF